MDSSEKCAFASIGEVPIDSEAVERISEFFDNRYAETPPSTGARFHSERFLRAMITEALRMT